MSSIIEVEDKRILYQGNPLELIALTISVLLDGIPALKEKYGDELAVYHAPMLYRLCAPDDTSAGNSLLRIEYDEKKYKDFQAQFMTFEDFCGICCKMLDKIEGMFNLNDERVANMISYHIQLKRSQF